MNLRLSACLLISTVSVAAWCAELPYAEDMRQDGKTASRTGRPIVALVSASDCHYCEVLKDNVLIGMERDQRIILRELAMDNPIRLIDFEGNVTDHRSFANKYGVFLTPTVLFLDGDGRSVAEPLIGVPNVDFYLYYLERRIAQSRHKLSN